MPTIAPRIETSQAEARELLRQALEQTNLSARSFAHVLVVDERTIRRWLAADRPMPGPVIQLCRLLSANPDLVTRLVRRSEPASYAEAQTTLTAGAR